MMKDPLQNGAYKNFIGVLFLLFLLITFFALSGCREEVIDPLSPVSNVNEPVQTITSNSYTFSLNASQITRDVENETTIYSYQNRVLVTARDYREGSVYIKVFDNNNTMVFESTISGEEEGLYASLNGIVPHRIVFKFSNFTGQLKFQISPLY